VTDIQLVINIITILGFVGALIAAFIKYIWPKLTQTGARVWNWWLLHNVLNSLRKTANKRQRISNKTLQLDTYEEILELSENQSETQRQKYKRLDTYKAIIERSKHHGLWKQQEATMQLEEYSKHRLRHAVRFFLLAESIDKARCASLLLEQNTIQPLFQFEIGQVKDNQKTVDNLLSSIQIAEEQKHKLGIFVDKCEQIMAKQEKINERAPKPLVEPIRIVVTQAGLPFDFYLFGHFQGKAEWYEPPKEEWGEFKPNKFWVISIKSLKDCLPDIPTELVVLRVMQRACVNAILPVRYSENKKLPHPRLSHYNTNSCLFDFTTHLDDIRYFVSDGFICEDCASEILRAKELPPGHRSNFLSAIQKWVDDTSKANLDTKIANNKK
jgi:hypothetical protein